MSAAATALLQQAVQLSEADCAELYEKLGHHLHRQPDSDSALTSDQKSSMDRRWDEILTGKVPCEDAFTVLDRIQRQLHERAAAAS